MLAVVNFSITLSKSKESQIHKHASLCTRFCLEFAISTRMALSTVISSQKTSCWRNQTNLKSLTLVSQIYTSLWKCSKLHAVVLAMLPQKWSLERNITGWKSIYGHVVSSSMLWSAATYLLKTQTRASSTRRYLSASTASQASSTD